MEKCNGAAGRNEKKEEKKKKKRGDDVINKAGISMRLDVQHCTNAMLLSIVSELYLACRWSTT